MLYILHITYEYPDRVSLMTMIQIRFVFRDSLGQLHSDKPAKIILPQPLPHELENGTDIRTIKDAIAYLQQREIPKRLWNIENNQVKAVHTVCRNGLETTQQGPMFAIYDNDVIAYSMVPDEDYIIVTSKEDEAVVAGDNDDGDATTETMEETQTQTTKNTLVVANVNDTIPDNNQVTPIQTLLDHQATDLPSTTAQKKKLPNEYYKNTNVEQVQPLNVEQVPLLTTQKRKESALESNVTTNAKKMKLSMQTVERKDSDVAPDSPNVVQGSLSTASKRKESTPECNVVTETNKSKVGTQTDTRDGQINKNSDRRTNNDERWMERFQKLKEYKKKNGHMIVQIFEDKDLYIWISNQRTCKKKSKMREDRLKLLEQIGFRWEREHITQLKTNSVYDKLTDEQKAELTSVINKMQDPRQEKWDKRWMEKFNKLKEYANKNGNMKVRGCEDKELYTWINTQRLWKRKNKLQKHRIKLLDELGFKWDSYIEQVSHSKTSKFEEYTRESDTVTDSTSMAQKRKDPAPESGIVPDSMQFIHRTKFDERWMEWFHTLKEYKRIHGHVMVRVTEDKDLYNWMSNQRKFKRNSNLREDRVKLLKEVGFSWESNTSIKQVST